MRAIVYDGESEIRTEPNWIKSVISLKEAVLLFQTTAVFRDLCQDLQRQEPESVESVDQSELEQGYYLLLNRIAKDTDKETATLLAAKINLIIQLEKHGNNN